MKRPMKKRWILKLVMLMIMVVALVGCRNKHRRKDQLTDNLRIPEHFKNIPADSPYVLADIKAFPYDQLNWQWVDSYQKSLTAMRQQMESTMAPDPEMRSPDEKLVLAILDEIDGRMNKEGLAELGLSTQAHMAFYGIGIFPAFRLELGDPAKFEAMLARIEGKVGESMPTKDYNGIKVRYIQEDDVFIPIMVTDTELLMGVTSTAFEGEFMGILTGKTPVEKNLFNDNHLLAMQKKYGMLPYVSGYVNSQGVVGVLLGDDKSSLTARSLASLGEEAPVVSDVCKAEMRQLAADVPRFVFGYTDVTKTSVSAISGLEMTSDLPKRLMAAKAPIPGHGSEMNKKALLTIGVGVDIAKFIEVLRAEAQEVGANPYKCEELDWMNESAEEFYFNAQQIPPFVRTIQGISFVLSDFEFRDNQVKKLQMMAVLHSSDPKALWDAVKPFIEGMTGPINLTDNGQAVAIQLPADVTMTMPDLPIPMLSMTKFALSLAMGPGMQDAAAAQMKQPAEGKQTPIFTFGYDISRFMTIINNAVPGGLGGGDPTMANMMEMYESFGPAVMAFDVTENGFFINVDSTLIPPAK